MSEPVLEVRRSRSLAYLQAIFTGVLLVLAVYSVVHFWGSLEGPRDRLLASAVFTVILAVYFVYTLRLCWDRTPVVVVGPAGLALPGALPDTIPWSTVHHVNHPGGFLLGRHRLDIDVDIATRARIKVGMRIAGDPIAGRIGSATGISIITQSLDTKPAQIIVAIKRYWPPPDARDDE